MPDGPATYVEEELHLTPVASTEVTPSVARWPGVTPEIEMVSGASKAELLGLTVSRRVPARVVVTCAGVAVAGRTATIAASIAPPAAIGRMRRNILTPMMSPFSLLSVGAGVGDDRGSEDGGTSSEVLVSQPTSRGTRTFVFRHVDSRAS